MLEMPCWYYEKKDLKNTPSFLNGVEPEVEARYRREGARFIINTGTKMGLRYDTMATGVIYFHRFYMFHSFKDFPRYVTACCCLFLAGKVEETPKKCKDIIKTARALLSDPQFAQFGEDPKEEVMTLERILLQTIKFDLQVDHPYSYLLRYAKCLKGDKLKLQKMVQMAWTFVNDSLCTTLSLQWEPEIIAIALMYLAGKLSKFEVADWNGRLPKHTRWWDMYVEDISMELLEDICHQVLDLYSNSPGANNKIESPPNTSPTPQIPTVRPVLLATPGQPAKSRNNSPAQPLAAAMVAIPVQVAKVVKQELPPHVKIEPNPPTVTPPKKIRLNPQPIPTVTDNLPLQVPVATIPVAAPQPPAYNYPPTAEQYGQFPPTAPVPPNTYQAPPTAYPSYPPPETGPPQYETDGQYNQQQHYSAPYDNSSYANYQPPAQPYYPVPPQPAPYPVGGYSETYQNEFPPTNPPPPVGQYSQPPNYSHPPQNPNYNPVPPAYAPPRVGPPVGQHMSPNPSGNIAPVRITGRTRQNWN